MVYSDHCELPFIACSTRHTFLIAYFIFIFILCRYVTLIDSDLGWLYECKWFTQAGPYCVYLHIIPLLIMYLLVCVVWMGGQLWVWMCAHVCVSASAVLCTRNCVSYTSRKCTVRFE